MRSFIIAIAAVVFIPTAIGSNQRSGVCGRRQSGHQSSNCQSGSAPPGAIYVGDLDSPSIKVSIEGLEQIHEMTDSYSNMVEQEGQSPIIAKNIVHEKLSDCSEGSFISRMNCVDSLFVKGVIKKEKRRDVLHKLLDQIYGTMDLSDYYRGLYNIYMPSNDSKPVICFTDLPLDNLPVWPSGARQHLEPQIEGSGDYKRIFRVRLWQRTSKKENCEALVNTREYKHLAQWKNVAIVFPSNLFCTQQHAVDYPIVDKLEMSMIKRRKFVRGNRD